MNKMNSNNPVSTTPLIIKNNCFNKAYTFSRKVAEHFLSTRNCLMLASSTIAVATFESVFYSRTISNTTKNDTCKPNDAIFTSLLCGLNTIIPTFICMVLSAMLDAHDEKYNNTGVITTADKKNSTVDEDVEKNIIKNNLTEDKLLDSKLLTKIKLKLIDIKNKLKNIDKSEAFLYFIFMSLFMLIITAIEYSSLPECSKSTTLASAIIIPVLAFLLFSLPVTAIKKIEGMSL